MTGPDEKPANGADSAAHAEAVHRAVREAVLTQARLGRPVVGWRDGRILWLPPQQVLEEFGEEPETPT